MTVHLHSHISFEGNAKEAMDFYKTVFGGDVFSDTFSSFESPKMPVAAEDMNKIMHAYLKGDNGIELMASDTPSSMAFDSGTRVTLSLSGNDETVLTSYWGKLAAGGTVSMPIAKAPWGDTFGMLTDKFGVDWMVNIGTVKNV